MNAVPIYNECAEPDLEGFDHPRVYRMLRPGEVRNRTTLSPAHTHRLQREGRFPLYDRICGRVCGLAEHVLDAFLAERMAARASMPALGLRKPLPQWHFSMDKVPAYCGIRLLQRPRVEELSGLPKSTFYPRIRVGLFPAQVPLGEWAARWVAHEVAAWILASHAPVSRGGAVERAQPVSRPSR